MTDDKMQRVRTAEAQPVALIDRFITEARPGFDAHGELEETRQRMASYGG
jgi:hypothetical protein